MDYVRLSPAALWPLRKGRRVWFAFVPAVAITTNLLFAGVRAALAHFRGRSRRPLGVE